MEEQSPFNQSAPMALPCSNDAEKGLLCSFFLSPAEVGGLCAEMGFAADFFHNPANATLYSVMAELWSSGAAVEPIAVTQKLYDRNLLAGIGPAYPMEVYTMLPTAFNARAFAAIVAEKYTLRRIIKTCHDFAAEAMQSQEDVSGLRARFEQQALSLVEITEEQDVPFSEHIMDACTRLEERYETRSGMCGLSYGLKGLDEHTGGMSPAEYIVIAAETSGGKTALACRIVEAVSVDAGAAAAVFSYEMSNGEITDRLLASAGRMNLLNYRKGTLNEGDFHAITRAAARMKDAKIFLRDKPDMHVLQVRAIARRLKRKHGLGLVVVDYAQLIPPMPHKGHESREQEVAKISRNLKAMAKELQCPVVALSQLNDDGKVRESRAIAQDANTLLIIQTEGEGPEERTYIRIAKQRNGPKERVPVTFLKESTRFEDAVSEHRQPVEFKKPRQQDPRK